MTTTPKITEHPLTREIAVKVLHVVDQGLSNGLGRPVPGEMCVEAAVCFAYGLPHNDNPPCVGRAVRGFKIALNDAWGWKNKRSRAAGMRRLAIAQLGSDELDQTEFASRLSLATIRTILPLSLEAVGLTAEAEACRDATNLEAAESAAKSAAKSAAWSAESAAWSAAESAKSAAESAESATWSAKSAAKSAAWSAESAAWSAAKSAAWSAESAAESAAWSAESAAESAESAAESAAWSAAKSAAKSAAWSAAESAAESAKSAAEARLCVVAEMVVQILIEMKSPGAEFLDLAPVS